MPRPGLNKLRDTDRQACRRGEEGARPGLLRCHVGPSCGFRRAPQPQQMWSQDSVCSHQFPISLWAALERRRPLWIPRTCTHLAHSRCSANLVGCTERIHTRWAEGRSREGVTRSPQATTVTAAVAGAQQTQTLTRSGAEGFSGTVITRPIR